MCHPTGWGKRPLLSNGLSLACLYQMDSIADETGRRWSGWLSLSKLDSTMLIIRNPASLRPSLRGATGFSLQHAFFHRVPMTWLGRTTLSLTSPSRPRPVRVGLSWIRPRSRNERLQRYPGTLLSQQSRIAAFLLARQTWLQVSIVDIDG